MSYLVTNVLIYAMFFGAIVLLIMIRILPISFSNSLYVETSALYLVIVYLYCLNCLVLSLINIVLSNSVGSDFVGAVG